MNTGPSVPGPGKGCVSTSHWQNMQNQDRETTRKRQRRAQVDSVGPFVGAPPLWRAAVHPAKTRDKRVDRLQVAYALQSPCRPETPTELRCAPQRLSASGTVVLALCRRVNPRPGRALPRQPDERPHRNPHRGALGGLRQAPVVGAALRRDAPRRRAGRETDRRRQDAGFLVHIAALSRSYKSQFFSAAMSCLD